MSARLRRDIRNIQDTRRHRRDVVCVEPDIERAATALRRLAQRRDLKAAVLATPEIYTALKHAARRYVAGEAREDALQLARSFADCGHRTTIDFMGEDTRHLADARAATEEFMSLCHALTSLRGPVVEDTSVSLDLSHIGLAVSERVAIDHASAVARMLADDSRELMISMESSAATEAILRVHTTLSERHPHVGITLQAALRRTDTDLVGALDRPGRIRLVKGAYGEGESIALPRGPELDERYRRFLDRILDAGHRCSIGTHDPSILRGIGRDERLRDLRNVEFEMLHGTTPAALDELRAAGYTTRVYTVYGKEWYLYLCHRLAEHPPSVLRALADATVSRVGIQGGRGSFNDVAARLHLPKTIAEFELSYLGTTPAVLEALDAGEIAYGQFALYNTSGGIYEESLAAIARHTFRVVDQYRLPIRHVLMARPEVVDAAQLTCILTHAQVMKQCVRSLRERFPELRVEIGQGELTDPAAVGAALSSGALPPSTGVISSAAIAEMNGLRVLAEDLQDDSNNASVFLLVSK
jgi:proline dehydrogenase